MNISNKNLSRRFLIRNYSHKKKSISELAKMANKDWATVKRYLLLNGIKLRAHKEQAAISSPGRKFKYLSILTKNFLKENYIKKKKSILQLAKENHINWCVIRRYMKRLKIKTRSSTEQKYISHPSKEFIITKQCLAFLDGLLLGDGSIPHSANNKYGTAYSYTQGCKYPGYLEYIQKRLLKFSISSSPILTRWLNDARCKKGGYRESFLQTHRYKTFRIFRQRWYKYGHKSIPKDFSFTPDSLLQFYLSDGNFYREIRLCGNFTNKDAKFLKRLFIRKLKFIPRLITSPWMKGRVDLAIRKSDIPKFLSYIGKCPVKCYRYKWYDNEPPEKRLEQNKRAREIYHFKKINYESKKILVKT